MDAKIVIRHLLETAELVCMAYIADLSDLELLQRPHRDCNHINWQWGHLIRSEHQQMSGIGGTMPELPDGFARRYSKDSSVGDDPAAFLTKDELLEVYRAQRRGTLELLQRMSPMELEQPTGITYAPTRAALFQAQGAHWLMHCGQWVIVRRMFGKPVVI